MGSHVAVRVLLAGSRDAGGAPWAAWIRARGHDVDVAEGAVDVAWAAGRQPLVILDGRALAGEPDLLARLRSCQQDAPAYVLLVAATEDASLVGAAASGADDVIAAGAGPAEFALRLALAERRIPQLARAHDEHRSLTDFLAQAPDLIQTVALDGTLLFVNRAWCEALGYAEDAIGGISFLDIVSPPLRPRVQEALHAAQQGQGIRHLQAELVARDGSVMSVEGSLTPHRRGDEATSVLVVLRDVSRRKRAETVLRNVVEGTSATTGKDFFRSLVRHLSQALGVRHALVAELLPGEAPVFQTLAVWAGAGYGPRREFPLVSDPGAAVFKGDAARLEETGWFPGARFLADLGAESYLGVPLKNAAGEALGLLCVLDDGPIPAGPDALGILSTFAQRAGAELERLRVQERLATSEARMRAMLDALPDLLVRLDAEGRYLSVHAREGSESVAAPEALLGRRLQDVLPPDVAAPCMAGIRAALESGGFQEIEYELPGSPGPRQFEVRLVPCGPGEVLGIVRDVTASRRAEAERRALDRRMQESQKLESLGVLAGGIAHDFNNLLTSIMGYASLTQRSLPPGSPAARYLADIEKAGRRAADLAMQMLAYSGKGQFVVQPLDLREVVLETAAFLRTDLNGRGVVLDVDLPDALPTVEGDATQMRQVVMNLVLNAAQATQGEPGRIQVGVRSAIVPAAAFATCYVGRDLPGGRYVEVLVRDEGCGMDPRTLERIFEPFFTTKTGGRGLGLAAVVGIVRGHRGALEVRSQPGAGTAVTVWFPPSEKSVPTPTPRQAPAPVTGEGLVLVVDDEPELRRLATEILEAGSYRVITAANGREGVELFTARADEIDAVLLDMTMPVMGGVEAFRGMRAVRPDARVLVSSGYTEQEAINRFRGHTPASFIQKPYTATELLHRIGRVLGAEALNG